MINDQYKISEIEDMYLSQKFVYIKRLKEIEIYSLDLSICLNKIYFPFSGAWTVDSDNIYVSKNQYQIKKIKITNCL
jgi:hypothetical protein